MKEIKILLIFFGDGWGLGGWVGGRRASRVGGKKFKNYLMEKN